MKQQPKQQEYHTNSTNIHLKEHKIVAQRMTLIDQQQQDKVFISGGEVLHHCTNNKENMASLPGNPQANLFVKLHLDDVKGLMTKAI